ncbi:hypothetical protein HU200_038313 [Digitaria exilis]|uniref:NB-ARC domain-containing protein n=1 Tax=Digitaria exilis TaxID=1010633 RepID=A0A835EKG5_9POAL|nr:hypothetical protein HU200_038313 [Digitaria exilis]
MECAFLYVLKPACSCLVSQATSSAAKEMELQEGVDSDAKFLADELDEMCKFLVDVDRKEPPGGEPLERRVDLDAEEEDTDFVNKIRDMACDINDCLTDLAPHRERRPSLWSLRPWASLPLRRSIAAELKDLVSRVNILNQRRKRYQRARERAVRKPTPLEEDARPVMPEVERRVDLGHLVARPDESLAVVSVWLMKDHHRGGGGGGSRAISLVGQVYDAAVNKFQCRAWVTATHPMSLTKFLRALARQLLVVNGPAPSRDAALSVLGDTEAMGAEELMALVAQQLGRRQYLVVVEDVCTRPQWDWIKLIFPDDNKGSRILVISQRADVARHCAQQPTSRSFNLEGASDDDARLYYASSSKIIKTLKI